ncbi:MAG: ECF transporter S component [Oscillospiraceae bacterium]|nr:ECF transporter S component [Oscillospiraceae bacterium]
MKKTFPKYSLFEWLAIALIAALGMAVKPLVAPIKLITGPLGIPGGSVAGGIYMAFPVIARGLVNKRFAATLTAVIQAGLVFTTGIGSQGAISIVSYITPGLAVDFIFLLFSIDIRTFSLTKQLRAMPAACFFAGMAANITGTFFVGRLLFQIPVVPLLLWLCVAAFSGGIGGLFAWFLIKQIKKLNILPFGQGK